MNLPGLVDGLVDPLEGPPQWHWGWMLAARYQACQAGAQESRIGASEEESGTYAHVGDVVTVALGYLLEKSVEPQAPEVVAHLGGVELSA